MLTPTAHRILWSLPIPDLEDRSLESSGADGRNQLSPQSRRHRFIRRWSEHKTLAVPLSKVDLLGLVALHIYRIDIRTEDTASGLFSSSYSQPINRRWTKANAPA